VDADADGCVLTGGQKRLLSGRVAVRWGVMKDLDGLEPVWVVVLSLERRYRGLTTVGENDGLEWADGLDGRVGEWCWRTTRGVR